MNVGDSWFGLVGPVGVRSFAARNAICTLMSPRPTLCGSFGESLRNVTVVPTLTLSADG